MKLVTGIASTVCSLSILTWGSRAGADQFHYQNLIIGTRAMGMGGAFGAVADDASGIYYNPAGLAFALSNDISGSANAFYSKEATYKDTIGGDDFVEHSGGSVAPFFGGLQKLDRHVPGLVFAFGVYSVDSDLKDQDTSIEKKTVGSTYIERYHRTSNARASTLYAGGGVGKRLLPNLAIGASMHYFAVDELVQEFQDAKQTIKVGQETAWQILSSNVRERLNVYGVQPVIGLQAALPGNVTLGATVKKGFIASETLQFGSEQRKQVLDNTGHDNLAAGQQATAVVTEGIVPTPGTTPNANKPIGDWPLEARLSTAWFASPKFLLAFDATYHSATSKGEKLAANGNKPKYNRDAITNFALGAEYYITGSLPLRFGLFTNNDSRPKVDKATPNRDPNGDGDTSDALACGRSTAVATTPEQVQLAARRKEWSDKYCGQPDHIDYLGGSVFIGWVQPNTQFSAGVVIQDGRGKAQKLGDHQVQEVAAKATTLAFSVTQNL